MDGPASVYAPARGPGSWNFDWLLPEAATRVYSLGRWAFVDALRLAGASGRRVLLPEFICREVLAALAEVEAKPVYYPVSPGLGLAADPCALPEAKAVVAVDYFGFPQNLAPFEEYCRRTGAVLIEDNAHGALSRDGSGVPLGGRAPLGVFSPRKTVSIPDGGALAVNAANRFPPLPGPLPFTGRTPGLASFGKRRALRTIATGLGPRWTLRVIGLLRALRRLKDGRELPAPDPDGERRIPIPPEPGPAQRHGFPQDPDSEVRRRRSLYAFCAERLVGTAARPVFKELPEGTSPYGFPFRAAPEDLASIEAALAAEGLFSLPWPDLPNEVSPRAPAHYRNIRLVHFQW